MKIELNKITKYYAAVKALDNVSFTLDNKTVTGFVGANGAGKSTAMRIITGILEPDYGVVYFDGLELWDNRKDIISRIGYMPDFFGLYERLSIYEYLYFFAKCYRIKKSFIQKKIENVLEKVKFTFSSDKDVKDLSRGMSQKVLLAKTLLNDPDLLILDEPASGLDPQARSEIMNLLKLLNEEGKTILISSHILKELSDICTHICFIENGRILSNEQLTYHDDFKVYYIEGKFNFEFWETNKIKLGIDSVEQSGCGWDIFVNADKSPQNEFIKKLAEYNIEVTHFSLNKKKNMENIFRRNIT